MREGEEDRESWYCSFFIISYSSLVLLRNEEKKSKLKDKFIYLKLPYLKIYIVEMLILFYLF